MYWTQWLWLIITPALYLLFSTPKVWFRTVLQLPWVIRSMWSISTCAVSASSSLIRWRRCWCTNRSTPEQRGTRLSSCQASRTVTLGRASISAWSVEPSSGTQTNCCCIKSCTWERQVRVSAVLHMCAVHVRLFCLEMVFGSACNQHLGALFSELCEVTEVDSVDAEVPIQYQCLECLALFDTPELWLAHRQTHSRSSTHSSLNTDTVSTQTHSHW